MSSKGQAPERPFLDRKLQQDQAAVDETGRISAYLDLADKAFEDEIPLPPKKEAA
jgi:hypothetical protein